MKLPNGPRLLWGENTVAYGSGIDSHSASTALRRFGRVLRSEPGLIANAVVFTFDENGDFDEAYLYGSDDFDRDLLERLYPAIKVDGDTATVHVKQRLTEIAFGEAVA